MKKLLLLGAVLAGYVLGTRAGRERYEQIRRYALRVKDDPRVQETSQQAADLAKEKAHTVATAAMDKVKRGSEEATSDEDAEWPRVAESHR